MSFLYKSYLLFYAQFQIAFSKKDFPLFQKKF